ncbi:MAG: hypothetical protein ABSF46_21285 [Terriglobia bacterium]
MKPRYELCIEIGDIPILVHTDSAEFAGMLQDRYGKFVVGRRAAGDPNGETPGCGEQRGAQHDSESAFGPPSTPCRVSDFQFPVSRFELEVELLPPGMMSDAEEARVRLEGGRWLMERGDFRAEWDPESHRGWVRQSANPYSIDAVLRMLHTLILAREGGFLVHAASAVRNGRAFLFAGVSGAGKTTISRLAPPDVLLLTDEISYVRKDRSQDSGVRSQNAEVGKQRVESRQRDDDRKDIALDAAPLTPGTWSLTPAFVAYGTPFAGELARIGENLRAPIAALYLLVQGPENSIEDVSQAQAVRSLLQNILFFADDNELVQMVFQAALEFAKCVPVRRLVFAPDARVWDLIG